MGLWLTRLWVWWFEQDLLPKHSDRWRDWIEDGVKKGRLLEWTVKRDGIIVQNKLIQTIDF